MFNKNFILPIFVSAALLLSTSACHIMSSEDTDSTSKETHQSASAPLAAKSADTQNLSQNELIAEAEPEAEEVQVPNSLKMEKPKKIKINKHDGYFKYEKNLLIVELSEKPVPNAGWQYSDGSPDPNIELTNEYYSIKPSESRALPGKKVFAFKTVKEGTTKLNFGYVRNEQSIEDTSIHFSLIVHIDEEGLIYRIEQKL